MTASEEIQIALAQRVPVYLDRGTKCFQNFRFRRPGMNRDTVVRVHKSDPVFSPLFAMAEGVTITESSHA
jgi:uncharacterized protein (UPF0548 family)